MKTFELRDGYIGVHGVRSSADTMVSDAGLWRNWKTVFRGIELHIDSRSVRNRSMSIFSAAGFNHIALVGMGAKMGAKVVGASEGFRAQITLEGFGMLFDRARGR